MREIDRAILAPLHLNSKETPGINDMRQLTDNESYRAIDWMRQARLCLESALALLRLDPGAMPFAYQTRYISADVNRLCERIEPVETT